MGKKAVAITSVLFLFGVYSIASASDNVSMVAQIYFSDSVPQEFQTPTEKEQKVLKSMIKVRRTDFKIDLDFQPLAPVTLKGAATFYKFPEGRIFWKATTLAWPGKTCQARNYHIVINEDSYDKETILNEIMGIAFEVALVQSGIDFCQQDNIGFEYRGKSWTLFHLEEAFSELTAQSVSGSAAISAKRLSDLRKITHPNYALARELALNAEGDPQRYRGEIEEILEAIISR